MSRVQLVEEALQGRVTAVSICQFVIASGSAGFAVIQSIGAEAYVELALAVHAVFFAEASRFRTLAISADNLANARFGGHG